MLTFFHNQGTPFRWSKTIKEAIQHYGYIPYNTIRTWYYSDHWGSNASPRQVKEEMINETNN